MAHARWVWGLVLLMFLGLAAAPAKATPWNPGGGPAGPGYADAPAWYVQDVWTYETHAVTRFPDGTYTDSTLVIDTRVVEVRSVTVRGIPYSVYNATTTGSVSTAGQVPIPGFGTVPFTMTGTTDGWLWTDRSDLATVATNQTGTASGLANLPNPFPDAPLTADGATTVLFLPAQEQFDFPLEGGDAWSYNVTVNSTGYAHVHADTFLGPVDNRTDLSGEGPARMALWFNVTEDVTVPAGTFLGAAHMHEVAPGGGGTDAWYHPSAKNLVRSESHTVNAPDDYVHVWVNLTAYTLVIPPPWAGTIALNPPRVNPGGWLTANGTASPDEDLLVVIPATRATYGTRSDAAGAWSVRIRAPLADDFTPANADVGSHGVLVHPLAAPETAAVATVQLILPDLSVAPADLVLSNPWPVAGVALDVNGTVHASAAVGVSSAFNTTFAVDGMEVRRYLVTDIPAGGGRTFGISWTARPGWHILAFTADPDGEVDETDEGNNTATRAVFVSGPDLVLWNLTVESETTAFVADPASAGFVMPNVQGRLGGTVNVTMTPRNVGGVDAPPGWVVRCVETIGLFGPPVGPILWESVANATLPSGQSLPPGTARWSVPPRAGVYTYSVTIDANATVDEESEANNTVAVVLDVSGPDYAIASLLVPSKVTAGSSQFLDVTVRNDGLLDGDRNVTLAAYEGNASTPFYTSAIAPLSVSQNATVAFPWTAPAVGSVVTLRFSVDPDGILEEMDESNNEASTTVDVRDAPTTVLSWAGPNVTTSRLFVTSGTSILLTATDRSGDGVTTYFQIDGGVTRTYAGPFVLPSEGPHMIAYWSEDNLGGEEAPHVLSVTVDDSPPETTASAGNRTGDRLSVSLTASDSWVGVAYVRYRLDGGNWTTYSGAFLVAGYGEHNITYQAIDLLGHEESEQYLSLTISRAPPSAVNLKPLLAAIFATVLFVVGSFAERRRSWSLSSPRAVGVIFALAEVATGVISTVSPALSIPGPSGDVVGFGIAVDSAIFVTGVFAVLFLRRATKGDEAPEAGTDK
ncbi:MAG TPA: CARDB domain-containing protein [Thermoplasmata archaeon]|nr:CARDB domain-containing protein [Thermoplasmata archaeon]